MQTLVQVVCNKNQRTSLRKKIVRDKDLTKFKLVCTEMKKNSRADGWAKLKSTDNPIGAINIQWESETKTLSARIVTKGIKQPSAILSDFINYIFSRHKRIVKAINIYPVE